MLFLLKSKNDIVSSLGLAFSKILFLWFNRFDTALFYIKLLRFSFLYPKSYLLDMCAYSLTLGLRQFSVMWYLFNCNSLKTCIFLPASNLKSIEGFFRNSRWLERETSENLGVYFSGKRDSRALFLVPTLFWAVLRKDFPTEGLVELRLDPWTGKLYPTFNSLVV